MKGQLLITQLTVLFEQGATQHGLRRQALAAGLLHAVAAQVLRYQPEQITMLIQPLRHGFQLAADLVFGEKIEYIGLDGAFLAHCRLRRLRVCL
ncbi:hypothetical protein GGD56_006597 [Rhizobium mongolense]|uniref:Uncharacterized protein n=2 Tax=Rhizobium mongolense TaxID=57676 RepID=A0ABR6IZ26_9HYPH|nr:hypothetical protein [Rhizobium mongolense]TVZ75200.1 hypothetical protein BCL32_0641 [Rhizobium mongolense USDA 1844]